MLTAYIVAMVVGGGLILLSAFAGLTGHADAPDADHDVHFDTDHEHDISEVHAQAHAHEGSNESWLPFLSLRFWTYFFGGWGLSGFLLAITRQTIEPITVTLASCVGLVVGLLAFVATKLARRADLDSKISSKDFLGASGRLVVAARPGQIGKARLEIKGEILDILVVSDNGQEIEAGEDVFVVGVDGSQARVTRQRELLEP